MTMNCLIRSYIYVFFFLIILLLASCGLKSPEYKSLPEKLIYTKSDSILPDTIIYHPVRVDPNGNILPWYSKKLGESYDDAILRVWKFWKNIEIDSNNLKYYMYHQVWSPRHDRRGLGGDQLQMALSSWNLLYDYTGDELILENMKCIADYYLAHSLSPPESAWPDLPFPYNTIIHSGEYDGDMILGKDYLQPDKGGSFGFELLKLYKITGDVKYLDAAIKMANTLAAKVHTGDNDHSPWPFKVNALTGEAGSLVDLKVWYEGMSEDVNKTLAEQKRSVYTTNWTGTLELFSGLIKLGKGNTNAYRKAFNTALNWLKRYPEKTNKWGPFFEDVPGWSDTQINAMTYAMYILEHPELDTAWETTVKNIIQWVHNELEDKRYIKYGVITTDEQTAYRQPGNSHSSRQASVELMYWEKTGDTTYIQNAVRELNWATYMVDFDGKNFYPTNAVWMTDGYGDYVRHYLRAMAAAPQLAPENADHLLKSSSIIRNISYSNEKISYTTFDIASVEILRLTEQPEEVTVNGTELKKVGDNESVGWTWQPFVKGGVLRIRHSDGTRIEIKF